MGNTQKIDRCVKLIRKHFSLERKLYSGDIATLEKMKENIAIMHHEFSKKEIELAQEKILDIIKQRKKSP